jgi:MFS family permease
MSDDETMAMVYLISTILVIVLGYLIDKYGRRVFILIFASCYLAVIHAYTAYLSDGIEQNYGVIPGMLFH